MFRDYELRRRVARIEEMIQKTGLLKDCTHPIDSITHYKTTEWVGCSSGDAKINSVHIVCGLCGKKVGQ